MRSLYNKYRFFTFFSKLYEKSYSLPACLFDGADGIVEHGAGAYVSRKL